MPLLDQANCASIPHAAVGVLAGLRGTPGIGIQVVGERVWLRWPANAEQVLRLLLPVPGAEFFVWHEGHWYRPGSRLPVSIVPALDQPTSLHQALFPQPVQPIPPRGSSGQAVEVWLRRSDRPRTCSALRCRIAELASWADAAPTAEIEAVFAARSGEEVILRGNRLPALPTGERFWGRDLLVPLGYEPVPALPERDLCKALGVGEDEVGLLRFAGEASANGAGPALLESLPAEAFEPLNRAAIRLALQEMARP